MENPAATQLPEVDALPDGFVDGTAEPLCPPTPNNGEAKPLNDCRIHSGNHLDGLAHELEDLDDKEHIEKNFGSPLTPGLAHSTHVDSSEVSGSCEVKEQAQEKFQSSDKSAEEKLVPQPTHAKEKSLPDGDDSLKNRKQEMSESKKNAKRSFKSEKEFLQFTLKYQQVLAERDAAIAVRDKLESLCRELQRQNKMLMDECKRVSTEGQNLRLDLSAKFQDAIQEVSNKLEQQKDECLSQLKENEMLKVKLKQLAEQYVLSEQHHEQELKQKSLELQIADLKMKQHEEKVIQEQSQMKVYAEQVSQLLETEKNLRLQLTADGEKFQQFQDALTKSNKVFETFKQEIEKMAKSIKDLKKENAFLKNKCEKSDITLIELVDERERSKKQMEKLKNQKEKLESLCRSLQAERKQNSVGGNESDPSLGVNSGS
ncbi:beta-taxilin [Rhodamnia argentea]|uniref:Beta-taxilin n=1 Tax=Rhodamnia argentea TaxID=178133 RepID=A0A8B8Q8P8_9MYRT|nr:beta-taxilin [Rhodamnia argentea]XP_048134883.1 beta-taxilin [Rhodamnia argentea]